ncbi:protein phosphatase 1 regulatory subunit 35 [Aplochiton taeniatus]
MINDSLSQASITQIPNTQLLEYTSFLLGKFNGAAKGPKTDPSPKAASEEPLGLLEGAELNSTLAMRAELQQLQGVEFNSQKALQETLEKSTRAKNQINTRVTEGVNIPPSQQLYRALVSISVEEELLISQTIRDRLLLVPLTRSHGTKPEREGPDLLQFYRADQLREKPLLLGVELSTTPPLPSVRPAYSTFDLYRRHTRWQAGP